MLKQPIESGVLICQQIIERRLEMPLGTLKSFGYSMMVTYLPKDKTISLFLGVTDLGGEAWTNTNGECQPHSFKSTGGEQWGITLSKTAPIPGYDEVLATGLKPTASPPATCNPPSPPGCSKK